MENNMNMNETNSSKQTPFTDTSLSPDKNQENETYMTDTSLTTGKVYEGGKKKNPGFSDANDEQNSTIDMNDTSASSVSASNFKPSSGKDSYSESSNNSQDKTRCENFEIEQEYEIGIAPEDKM